MERCRLPSPLSSADFGPCRQPAAAAGVCDKDKERELRWLGRDFPNPDPEQLGVDLQVDVDGDTGGLDPQAAGQTANPGYACIQHHSASVEATIATNGYEMPWAQLGVWFSMV